MNVRSGKLVTNLSGEAEYRSFLPSPLPPAIEIDGEMLSLLIDANKQIYALERTTGYIPNSNLFISMYVRKEALMSSQIEGTQATLEDILDPAIDKNANRDVSDVVNYIRATEYALERLNTLPLCNRLIKETHAVLMKNARGQERSPGEFRTSQSWIGGSGSAIKNARYIPPSPNDMIECMSDLEEYINDDDGSNALIKAALIHYQFETIHPFLDGNGRIGRLLITLFLMEEKVLSSPVLYISYYLKENRVEYYDRMTEVRRSGNYEQWVKFFLHAVIESAKDAINTIDVLHSLHEDNMAKIETSGKALSNTKRLFEYIEQNPIIDVTKTAKTLGISYNTASTAINNLCSLSILEACNANSKNKTFVYAAYLETLKKGTKIQ